MFSSRVPANLAPNRLARALEAVRREGRPVIDLTESNPTRAGFQYPADLLTPLADRRALVYRPEPFGLPEARRAVAADYQRRAVAVASDRIVLTTSTSEAYSLLFKVLCDPSDEVLVPRPSYPLFEHLTQLDVVAARSYDLEYHGAWSMNFASIEHAWSSRTRAVLVVTPNNPTGSFVKPAEIDRLAALCAARDAALIADEVFADYELVPGRSRAGAKVLARRDVLAFGLGGLSKSIGLPQAKLAWFGVAGPDATVEAALARLELACDTYLSVSTPVQVAAADLLAAGAAVRGQIQSRITANYQQLIARAAETPACSVLQAEGGWYAVVRVPSLGTEEDLAVDLLTTDGVLAHPGYFFDFPRESYLVVSLLVPEAHFSQGITRLLRRAAATTALESARRETSATLRHAQGRSEPSRRASGLLIPLFSCPSTTSWGIGDMGDLAGVTAWLAGAGQRVLQLLPLNEMAPSLHSPYSPLSSMAIDPVFIRMSDVPEFARLGGEASLSSADRASLDEVRRTPRVDYARVRRLKNQALRAAFEPFYEAEWCRDTDRARAFKEFVARQAWWLEDYALFRSIHVRETPRRWTEWPEPLARREPAAVDRVRRELFGEVLFYQYLQWVADTQWQAARDAAHANGIELFGDLPFMVDGDSADVWARQHQFRLDASLGAPPDAFSATGQNWGMPLYRWDLVAADDFRWLRHRARRYADLYDGYRADHIVGFFRTYGRPHDGGEPFFTPAEEHDQIALGERILAILREAGAPIIAEDLGTVPEFVRASLARMAIPGFRVFRWERFWHTEGQPFREPSDYPAISVATTGTHDTEPLAVWWERAPEDERRKVAALASIQQLTGSADLTSAPYEPTVRDTLIEALFASGSDLLLLPIQDLFGWPDRINDPATVGDQNWTFRLPWPSNRLADVPEARERQERLREWTERHGR